MMPIRTFRLPKDADIIVDIIPRSFRYPENPEWNLDDSDVADIESSMKSAKTIYPLLRFAGLFVTRAAHILDGFIWEEGGEPVAICNIVMQDNHRWMIGNVSVVPEYRRRGIGKKLVKACIDHAAKHGAEQIILDVIEGNVPAYELYIRLGFEHYTSAHLMDYSADMVKGLAGNLTLQELKLKDWQLRRDFMRRVKPIEIQRFEPVKEDSYRFPLIARPLVNLIMAVFSSERRHFAAVDDNGQVYAVATYDVPKSGKGIAELDLIIAESHAHQRPEILKWLIKQSQTINPDARIEFSVLDWQVFDETSSPQSVGFIERVAYHRLGMLMDR